MMIDGVHRVSLVMRNDEGDEIRITRMAEGGLLMHVNAPRGTASFPMTDEERDTINRAVDSLHHHRDA